MNAHINQLQAPLDSCQSAKGITRFSLIFLLAKGCNFKLLKYSLC